jgi:hypothetical protein
MHGSRLACWAVALPVLVYMAAGTGAQAQSGYCYPPNISRVPPGAIVGGKLCTGRWGCTCVHWFCPQCPPPPSLRSPYTGPLGCERTTCTALRVRGR